MNTALRHVGRLSTRVAKRRARHFHTTCSRLADDGRPEERDKSRAQELANRRLEQPDEHKQDTGDAAELRKNGLRRTLRQRRHAEPPKPPPLPEWFLDRNVALRELKPTDSSKEQDGSDREIECFVRKSGEVLFRTTWTEELAALIDQSSVDKQDEGREPGRERAVPHTDGAVVEKEPGDRTEPALEDDIGYPHGLPTLRESTARSFDLEPVTASLIEAETLARATFALAGKNISTFAASKTGLSLECVDETAHARLDHLVHTLGVALSADVITLDANDIADLTEDYVGQGNDLPGTFSTLAHDIFQGRQSHKLTSLDPNLQKITFERPFQDEEDHEENEDDEDEIDAEAKDDSNPMHQFKSMGDFVKSQLQNLGRNTEGMPTAFSFAVPAGIVVGRARSSRSQAKNSSSSDYVQWDDARLSALLDHVLDAPEMKRAADGSSIGSPGNTKWTQLDDERVEIDPALAQRWQSRTVATLSRVLSTNHSTHGVLKDIAFRQAESVPHISSTSVNARTIVHVRDLHDICTSKLGDAIVRRLSKVVQKRRRLGSQIIIIGTSVGARNEANENDDSSFVDISIPSEAQAAFPTASLDAKKTLIEQIIADRGYHRILEVNTRNIWSMLRRTQPELDNSSPIMLNADQMLLPGAGLLVERVLSQDQVHRIVLGAIGIAQKYMKSDVVRPIHISLAAAVVAVNDEASPRNRPLSAIPIRLGERLASLDAEIANSKDTTSRERLDRIKKSCNSHETRLLSGVVDAQNLKTGFKDVHVSPETIEALKTLTTLSLLRPDAFKYGVLATDNLTGLMLYGPPGTGKTLLAKAVAKESKATVLEISGAQVYEKYVGEGEKMVRAVFTLAKKLSPCVVFIDEADALFGTRSSAGNRSTHREIINQFLREWDGMDDHRVFMMVASNRPFDMDDAVLRRLPRRLLVDLPLPADREKILGIHLRNEALDSAVSLSKLAEQTPLYSGSDLKNLCVAAALAAVREENDLVAQHEDDSEFKLPEKRTLQLKHFEKGLQEISASISEDMSSLTAIRKFDEQYGDRKGRRKKASYGFGALGGPVDEGAARVRQGP